HRVSEFWVSGIGNVIDKEAIGNRRVVSEIADDPFFGPLEFFEGSAPYDLDLTLQVTGRDHNRRAARKISDAGRHNICARLLSNKAAIRIHHRACSTYRPPRSELVRRHSLGSEVNDIAGARAGRAAGN